MDRDVGIAHNKAQVTILPSRRLEVQPGGPAGECTDVLRQRGQR